MPLPREIYRTEPTPFEFKPNEKGGYDVFAFGYANFGWEKPTDGVNYTGPYVINTIGNWRYSYISPAILHMIALFDCERVSGPKPENKWHYQTDRYLGYMTGFNSAQYAIGMRDSWFPFMGIISQALVSVRKGTLQKTGRHWYDDKGSTHGWLAGFGIGAISELLYKEPQISWGRLFLAILPGVIPAMIQAVKTDRIQSMFGTGTGFTSSVVDSPSNELYYSFDEPRAKGSSYYHSSNHLNGIVRGLKIEGFDNIVEEFALGKTTDKDNVLEPIMVLLTSDGVLLEDMLFLILQSLMKLQIEGRILEYQKEVAEAVLALILEPAFIPFTTETSWGQSYMSLWRQLNKLLIDVGSVKSWATLFKKSIRHRHHTFPHDKLGNSDREMKAWPQLFNVGGNLMFPREMRTVFDMRIDICFELGEITSSEATTLKKYLVGNFNTNQFNHNYYKKHKVHYIDELPPGDK